MAKQCSNCRSDIPESAQFCIECGQSVAEKAATGPTERLDERAEVVACNTCGGINPAYAGFCMQCGNALTGSEQMLAPLQSRTPSDQSETSLAPPTQLPQFGGMNPNILQGILAGVFLIGLAFIARFGLWWPGILVLIGSLILVWSAMNGQLREGMQGAIWLLGIAFIAAFGLWWPGILVLVGLSVIINTVLKSNSQGF
ncbi:MAG: zinc ribbon domain-containing protein [Chloroflexota bacterium]